MPCAKGLKAAPWVKTSLGPGSLVVTDYLKKAGVLDDLEKLGFYVVGYGCTTCIGNSGPLPDAVSKGIAENDLVVAAVLSGNRNFEGRVHAEVKMNYLASPPLVVAYALAGTVDIDLTTEPLGDGSRRQAGVTCATSGRRNKEIGDIIAATVGPEMFTQNYADVFKGDSRWNQIASPEGESFAWDEASTYIKNPPYFDGMTMDVGTIDDIHGARVLGLFGDSITTDHISPAGNIKKDSPAGRFLQAHGVQPADFNSYGSRRGNDDVMVRGTFANIRIKNLMFGGEEGGNTLYFAKRRRRREAGDLRRGDEVQGRRRAAGGVRRQGIRHRLLARLGGQGHQPARREGGRRRELRAHPPLQPGRHGRAAAAVQGRRERAVAGPGRRRDVRHRRPRRRRRPRSRPSSRRKPDGSETRFEAQVLLLTPKEVEYFRHGGILHYVLRQLAAKKAA